MAFNWPSFRTRTITAILFLAVMAIGLLWNQWSFFILFTIVHFGAWFEFHKLVSIIDPSYAHINAGHRWGAPLCGWMAMMFFTNGALNAGNIDLHTIGFWGTIFFFLFFPLAHFFGRSRVSVKPLAHTLFGLIYISLPLAFLIDLRHYNMNGAREEWNKVLPLLVIFSIWINDTMAYIVGSLIGKTKLSSISPNKTWEGTVGGAILAVVTMALIAYFTGLFPVSHTIAISAIAAVTGTFGDLFESKLKRLAGVKDSGSFMPGHGGFLDRFDSLLFAATAVWIYVRLFLG